MSVAAAASCTGWARAVCWVALLAGVWCVAFHVSHANAEEFCRRYVHDYTAEERLGLSPAFTFASTVTQPCFHLGRRLPLRRPNLTRVIWYVHRERVLGVRRWIPGVGVASRVS